MGYWKSKVLPTIKKVFELKGGAKKAAAADAIKSFDDSKGEIEKEFEEKKEDLKPKVLEIYEASSVEIKTVVKERTEEGLKKHSTPVKKFLEELVKIEFPGSKHASEAASKCGPAMVSTIVVFVFEKVSVFLPPDEPAASEVKEAEVVAEAEKKEDEAPPAAAKSEEVAAAATPSLVIVEEVKVVAVEVKEVETAPASDPVAKP